MKNNKMLKSVLVLAVAVLSVSLVAGTASAVITGSKHDFSGEAWNSGSDEVCNVCHTPHNADATPLAPLWNHESSVGPWTPYADTNGTLDATDVADPSGASKACLSCHDGTVALDSYGGVTGGTNITGSDLLSADLSNDHPISFTYDSALQTADGGLNDPTSLGNGVQLFGAGNDQVECSSCHDVHNGAGVVGQLLVSTNSGSALCLTCHAK